MFIVNFCKSSVQEKQFLFSGLFNYMEIYEGTKIVKIGISPPKIKPQQPLTLEQLKELSEHLSRNNLGGLVVSGSERYASAQLVDATGTPLRQERPLIIEMFPQGLIQNIEAAKLAVTDALRGIIKFDKPIMGKFYTILPPELKKIIGMK